MDNWWFGWFRNPRFPGKKGIVWASPQVPIAHELLGGKTPYFDNDFLPGEAPQLCLWL